MKWLKRIFIGIAFLFVLLIAAAFILPPIFKEDIKAAIDKELAASVNADVKYSADDFSLSLFRHFPSISVEMKKLGVYNRAPFEGVPLFVLDRLDVQVNVWDLLFGKQMRVKGITLIRPQIQVKVLKDGRANYDIAIPSADTVKQDTAEPSKFSFGIDHWEVVDGQLLYEDASLNFQTSLKGLQHTGSGDFTEKEFDLTTNTTVDSLSMAYGGVSYLSNKKTKLKATIGIAEDYSKYTFKDNELALNDFIVQAEGWVKLLENQYDMDIALKSPQNTFKSLLSLVPGIYTENFKDVEASGELSFGAKLKGTYSDKQMPAFHTDLKVVNGFFKYPKLPAAVKNIQLDLMADNATGVIENTKVMLQKLHLEFGSNPVDAQWLVENLKNYKMKGNVNAKLNLGELTQIFPIDSMQVKGNFALQANVDGVYDSLKKIIPAVQATMSLNNGYVKADKFPLPLENMNMNATIVNTSGKMAETEAALKNFSMKLGQDEFSGKATVTNLDDYTWNAEAKGSVDLEKIMNIFPQEGMKLAGIIKADITTQGKYSYVEKKQYDKLPASGSMEVKNFVFEKKELPYKITIAQSSAVFNPGKIELKNTTGTLGKTDFQVDGSVSNYIGYMINNSTLQGNLNFKSNLVDLNELMADDPNAPKPPADTTSLQVVQLPENIDFVLHSNIQQAKWMDYNISQAKGDVVIRKGVAYLQGITFNMLGGSFGMDGSYQAKDKNHPKYDMALKISDLAISQAAQSFSMVKKLAPIAGAATGNFSTDFKLSGELTQNMMPNLGTVSGAGLIKIAQAAVANSKLVSGITSLTKLQNTDQVSLKDVLMNASIQDGKLSVQPFDVKFGNFKTTVSGASFLNGGLDFNLKMNVPAGQLGTQLQGFLNSYTGSSNTSGEIPVSIGVGGTFANPKPTLLASEQKAQVKEAVTNMAKEKATEAVQNVLQGKNAKDIVGGFLGGNKKTDSTQASKPATKTDSVKTKAVDEIKGKLNNLFKRKSGN